MDYWNTHEVVPEGLQALRFKAIFQAIIFGWALRQTDCRQTHLMARR